MAFETEYTDGIYFNGKATASSFDTVPIPIFQGSISGVVS